MDEPSGKRITPIPAPGRWGLLLYASDLSRNTSTWYRAASDGALAPIPTDGRRADRAVVSPGGGKALFYRGDFDAETRRTRGAARLLVDFRSDSATRVDFDFAHDGPPAWSNDEARLAYNIDAPSFFPGEPDSALEIRDLRDGSVRRMPSGPLSFLEWQPDDREILAVARDRRGAFATRISVDDLSRSTPARLPIPRTANGLEPSPGGRFVTYFDESDSDDEDGYDLFVRRGSDRRMTRLGRSMWDTPVAWSPRGSDLAFVAYRDGDESADKRLCLLDAEPGSVRDVAPVNAGDAMGDMAIPLAWSPDGELLAFSSFEEDGRSAISLLNLASWKVSEFLRTDELVHTLAFIEPRA